MKLVERVKIKSGKLKDKTYRMVLTPSGYVPRDPTYPLSESGKEAPVNCEKVPKVKVEEVAKVKEVKK